jgi:hypothetical protein
MTGLQVKRRIMVRKGIEVEHQSLIVGGREISSKDRLIDHDIRRGSIVLDISSFVLVIYLFRFTWLLKQVVVLLILVFM